MALTRCNLAFVAVLSTSVLVTACGSNTPSTQTPPPATSSGPAKVVPPDLSPVSAPDGLVLRARWASPHGSAEKADKILKLSQKIEEIVKGIVSDPDVANLVKLDAPFDAAVALDPDSSASEPQGFAAFSLPLNNLDEAVKLAKRNVGVSEIKPGVYRVGTKKPSEDVSCAVAASVGAAPARLVCGPKQDDVDALLPWLTRGFANEKFGNGGDFRLEANFAPFHDLFDEKITKFTSESSIAFFLSSTAGIKDAKAHKAAGEIATNLGNFAKDLDGFALEAQLGDGGNAQWSITSKFKGSKSWFTRMITSRNGKAAAPPAVFWRLPKDADTASFNQAIDPKLFGEMKAPLSALVESLLGEQKVPGKDVKALSGLISDFPLTGAPFAVATGYVGPKKKPMGRTGTGEPTPAEVVKGLLESNKQQPWFVMGIEAPAKEHVAWLKKVAKAYNSRKLKGFIKDRIKDVDKKIKPDPFFPRVVVRRGAGGLPRKATVMEISLRIDTKKMAKAIHEDHPKGKTGRGTLKVYLAVMPDGKKGTIIGFSGSNTKALKAHMEAMLSSAKKEGTLAAASDLGDLKSAKAISGGFMRANGIVRMARNGVARGAPRKDVEMLDKILAMAPNKGMNPVICLGTGTTGTPMTNTATCKAPAGAVEDLVTVVQTFAMMRGGMKASAEPAATPEATVSR